MRYRCSNRRVCATMQKATTLTLFDLPRKNGLANKLDPEDRPVHDWYRFVLSFPPHLIREYMGRFGINSRHLVLDPFCGTGTTVVECKDKINVVQVEQDIAMCVSKFPDLICRPIAAQFMAEDLIALLEFERQVSGVKVTAERHYRLVEPEEIDRSDLETYQRRTES